MSEITLRRANKLRAKCEARLQEIRRELSGTNVSINIFSDDAFGKVSERQEELARNIARFTGLNNAVIDLRVAIAEANIRSGVSEKLALINGYSRLAEMYLQLSGGTPSPSDSEMLNILSARKHNYESSAAVSYHDDVNFSVLRKDVIDSAKQALSDIMPRVSNLQDEIEQANAATKVTIDDVADAILASEKLN